VILIFVVVNLSVRSMAHGDDDIWRQASRAFIQLRGEVDDFRRQTRTDVERIDQSLRGLWRLTRRLETIVNQSGLSASPQTPRHHTSCNTTATYSMAGAVSTCISTASVSQPTLRSQGQLTAESSTGVPPLFPPGVLPAPRRPTFPPRYMGPNPSVAMPPLPVAPSFPAECSGYRVHFPPEEGGSSSSEEEPAFPSCDKRCRDCWRFHERGPCEPTTSK
jgi:hypothetical protein